VLWLMLIFNPNHADFRTGSEKLREPDMTLVRLANSKVDAPTQFDVT
jgi:hypothetical protein